MSNYKIILLTIYPNLLSYKALSGNTIYEMKVFLNIDGVIKLFEIVVLANFMINNQKNQKGSCYIFILFLFEDKDHCIMSVQSPCIIYFNIMGFVQSKLNELQLLSFLENCMC